MVFAIRALAFKSKILHLEGKVRMCAGKCSQWALYVLLAITLVSSCTTLEDKVLPVLSIDEMVGILARGRSDFENGHALAGAEGLQQGSVLAAELRRGLLDVLKISPRLHVQPQRRALDAKQLMRLEVEETGHAVSVSRGRLLHKFRAPRLPDYDHSPMSTLSTHVTSTTTPEDLIRDNCTTQAQSKASTRWRNENYNLISHGIIFGATPKIPGNTEVIAVVMSDPDMYKKEQWVNDEQERNAPLDIDVNKVGFSM